MAEIIPLRSDPHQDVQQLFPWLLNGTLSLGEVEQVEAHLAQCASCRDELELDRKLAEMVERMSLEPGSSLETIGQRFEPTSKVRQAATLWHRRVPLGWAIASPAMAAAAVAIVIVALPQHQPSEPSYHALASPLAAPSANLVVQFERGTRVDDMQEALHSVNARLVDGPTETGAYLLRVDLAKRDLVLKQLRDNPAISLAQPIDQPDSE